MARDITQLYCERTTLEFWGEPFNAISNAAFLVAALYAVQLLRTHGLRDRWLWALAANIGVIGVGSFIFHTGPSLYSFAADVVPIAVFIAASFTFLLKYGFDVPIWRRAGWVACLFASMIFCRWAGPADFRIGVSFLFIPVVVLLAIFSILYACQPYSSHSRAMTRLFALASGVFAMATITRALDTPLCAAIPIGLHFVWHILNACVCYWVFKACVLVRLRA